jgi:hypothetical protein
VGQFCTEHTAAVAAGDVAPRSLRVTNSRRGSGAGAAGSASGRGSSGARSASPRGHPTEAITAAAAAVAALPPTRRRRSTAGAAAAAAAGSSHGTEELGGGAYGNTSGDSRPESPVDGSSSSYAQHHQHDPEHCDFDVLGLFGEVSSCFTSKCVHIK